MSHNRPYTMEPSPPRKPKELPFYETPGNVMTGSKIIREAKNLLSHAPLKTVYTRRPDTPQDGQRKLFGEQSTRDPSNRPPSAFSLGSRHFDSDSRPPSGIRLKPLDHRPQLEPEVASPMAPKPPADPNRPVKRPTSRQRMVHQPNADGSTGGEGSVRSRSGSLQDVSDVGQSTSAPPVATTSEAPRRVHSGPKERTPHLLEERGEGDGSETLPRTDSRIGKPRKDSDHVESGYGSDVREGSAGSQRVSSAGKTGSAGRREEETAEEALFYNTKIGPVIEAMTGHIKDKDPERLLQLSDHLYLILKDAGLLGKACKRRSTILKTIYKLLDVESPKVLLRLASLILALKVSGNNLANVCKVIFKVSKEEKNDMNFTEGNILENILDTVRTTDPSGNIDALTYCVGSVKFLTGNSSITRALVKHNCVEALAKLLITINKTNSENSKPSESLGNILVQLTGSLRNISDVSNSRHQFLSYGVIPELCVLLDTYPGDSDLMLNVSRVFSKLTQHTECANTMSKNPSHFKYLLYVLKLHVKREDLVVRISFIMGNLTAKNDQARMLLFQQGKCLDTLLTVFKYYIDKEPKKQSSENKEGESESKTPTKVEDVCMKVIRVIANLSINEEIGPVIAASEPCLKLLLQILTVKEISSSEELVLNTMATINNLSYYNVKDSAVTKRQTQVAQCLLKFLNIKSMEGLAEATRVFGNLSRERNIRDFLSKNKVLEMMIALLDSGSRDVVYTAVGVLINLMADEEKRPMLQKEGGVKKLIDVLRDFGREDWSLAGMVCQTLCNYSSKITSTNACFGEGQAQDLVDVLEEFLDEEGALDVTGSVDLEDEEVRLLLQEAWKNEFYPVGSRLLERIDKYQSDFEPLEEPT